MGPLVPQLYIQGLAAILAAASSNAAFLVSAERGNQFSFERWSVSAGVGCSDRATLWCFQPLSSKQLYTASHPVAVIKWSRQW